MLLAVRLLRVLFASPYWQSTKEETEPTSPIPPSTTRKEKIGEKQASTLKGLLVLTLLVVSPQGADQDDPPDFE